MTNRLRRYALFAFEQYYPGGGWQIVDLYDGSRVV